MDTEQVAVNARESLDSLLVNLAEAREVMDDYSRDELDREEARAGYEERILAIDTRQVHRVLLGFGGPNVWLDVTTIAGEITRVQHGYAWYSEPVLTDVEKDSSAWEYVEYLSECGLFESE